MNLPVISVSRKEIKILNCIHPLQNLLKQHFLLPPFKYIHKYSLSNGRAKYFII